MRYGLTGLALLLLAAWPGAAPGALAQEDAAFSADESLNLDGDGEEGDHHEGYYYPRPDSVEHIASATLTLPDSDKARRMSFVLGMTRQLLGGQYAPSYAIFAKGDDAQKLIVVGVRDGELDTVYRVRALLANFTSIARLTPFFQQNTQPEEATFFDLMKLLGFRQITITDGRNFAHQVIVD